MVDAAVELPQDPAGDSRIAEQVICAGNEIVEIDQRAAGLLDEQPVEECPGIIMQGAAAGEGQQGEAVAAAVLDPLHEVVETVHEIGGGLPRGLGRKFSGLGPEGLFRALTVKEQLFENGK